LLFCTTGILLARLQSGTEPLQRGREHRGRKVDLLQHLRICICRPDPTLKSVSHVVLDEVHERSVEGDLLLAILRDLLVTARPDLRIVLMSASMEAARFAAYFAGAPVLEIPGFTHPVEDLYMEDVVERTGFRFERLPRKPKYAAPDADAPI